MYVTILSTGGNFQPVSKFTELHILKPPFLCALVSSQYPHTLVTLVSHKNARFCARISKFEDVLITN